MLGAEFGVPAPGRVSITAETRFGELSLNYRIVVLFGLISVATASVRPISAQEKAGATPADSVAAPAKQAEQTPSPVATPPSEKIDSPQPKVDPKQTDNLDGQQTKRILFIIPNYRSVSANTHLPPQSVKEKFWLATQDSFDYSAFIYEGIIAGIAMAGKSTPAFGQGASGYGLYYAHSFADGTIENYMVEAIVPTATKQDPRYYTLGRGGFLKRAGYAVSRLLVTRTDSGKPTFNVSEVVGAGGAAGISNLYYPTESNPWVKTYQRWGSQLIQDGLSNLTKEFWPDVNRAIFHNKY
jgi:hypothetical protein